MMVLRPLPLPLSLLLPLLLHLCRCVVGSASAGLGQGGGAASTLAQPVSAAAHATAQHASAVTDGLDLGSGAINNDLMSTREVATNLGPQGCSSAISSTSCPDARALLAFKASNIDSHGVLDTWRLPCPALADPAAAVAAPASSPDPSNSGHSTAHCRNVSRHICQSWAGIQCSLGKDMEPRVTSIKLSENGPNLLRGNPSKGESIPPEIGDLKELEHLDLSFNFAGTDQGGLIGSLPLQLSTLTKLTYLNLYSNCLCGPIPDWIGNLPNFVYLNLGYNKFSGTIPSSLGHLSKLKFLGLSRIPSLSGSIPAELSTLTGLTNLDLQYSALSGNIPDSLSSLTALCSLQLNSARLSGTIPAWIGSASLLTSLWLNNNQLTGTLPAALGRLSNLGSLILDFNSLTGPIPPSVTEGLCNSSSSSRELYTFSMSHNQVSGGFPLGLSACTSLTWLDLSYNRLSGPFPSATFFHQVSRLTNFQVAGNALTGTVPISLLSLMPGLQYVGLQGNKISGPMPPIVCPDISYPFTFTANFSRNWFSGGLPKVLGSPDLADCSLGKFVLDFSDNWLSGPLNWSLLALTPLNSVRLSGNKLSGALAVPPDWTCSPNLVELGVSRNQLSGPIPSHLGACTNLQVLDLSSNSFTGPIPTELHSLHKSLLSLQLQQNQLTGGIPSIIERFKSLTALNLSHNDLNEPLPQALCLLPSLAQLDISSNHFQGPMPACLGNLSMLQLMAVQENALSGSIPVTIAPPNLTLLRSLNLSHNSLSGAIPEGFANPWPNCSLDFSFNNLCGPIPGGERGAFASTKPISSVANNPQLCGGMGYAACPSSECRTCTGQCCGLGGHCSLEDAATLAAQGQSLKEHEML